VNLPLTLFCAFNQAYFMGFFFLLAGYFTPPAFERKGWVQFFKERLIRLGIPLLGYGFILGPLTIALAETAKGISLVQALLNWPDYYFNIGPLWFAEALLIFAGGYGLWQLLKLKSISITHFPSPIVLMLVALMVGAMAFGLRLIVPLGHEFINLQIGYFASYIVLFVAGCLAWSGRWLERVESVQAKPWALGLAIAIPSLPVAIALSADIKEAVGGWNFLAIFYAFWEPFVAWGVILGLLWQFRVRFNQPSPLGTWLAQRAYGVYIIHPPILVGISLLLHRWAAAPLVKFLVVGSLASLACVTVANLLLLIPGARRVL